MGDLLQLVFDEFALEGELRFIAERLKLASPATEGKRTERLNPLRAFFLQFLNMAVVKASPLVVHLHQGFLAWEEIIDKNDIIV